MFGFNWKIFIDYFKWINLLAMDMVSEQDRMKVLVVFTTARQLNFPVINSVKDIEDIKEFYSFSYHHYIF